MSWQFADSTDQIITPGWSGSVSTIGCWWYQDVDTDTSADPWGVYPLSGGGGAIRALLGTLADGTSMRLFDSAFAAQVAGAPGVGVWYCTYAVMNGTDWTVYHGTDPAALTQVGPNTRVSFSAPGSVLLSLAVEPLVGRMAAIKVWTAALTAAEVARDAAYYNAIRTSDLRRGMTCLTSSMVPDVNGTSDFTALTPGSTSVDITFGPTQLDYPIPRMITRSLPNRMLRVRRGRFFTPVRLPENNSPQALPPQYFRRASTHQRLRRIDRNGFYKYPVLETEPPPVPPNPPDATGGSFSPSWRRRVYRKRRRALISNGVSLI